MMRQQQRKRAAPDSEPAPLAAKRAKALAGDDDCVSLASLLRSKPSAADKQRSPRPKTVEKVQQKAKNSSVKSEPKLEGKTKLAGRTNEQGEAVFELAARRRVTVRKWRSATLVDVREFYDDQGTAKPGKKGISLSLDQWRALAEVLPDVSDAIELVEDDRVSDAGAVAKLAKPIIGADSGEDRSIGFELSAKRRVTARIFRSAVLIDIREYYDKDGKTLPGNKGISLSKTQWIALQELEPDITEAANQL